MTDFGRFFRDATGYDPYPYQSRLAADGFPDVLRVDTGCWEDRGGRAGMDVETAFRPGGDPRDGLCMSSRCARSWIRRSRGSSSGDTLWASSRVSWVFIV